MFPVSRLKWQRYWTQRSFDRELAKLKKTNASNNDFLELNHNEYEAMRDIEDSIDYVVSRRLLDAARSLDVEIPPIDNVLWSRSQDGETVWLTSHGRSLLRKSIDQEKERRFEIKTRWIVKIILPIMSIIIGIIGAITGLIAVQQKKETRPPISGPHIQQLQGRSVSTSPRVNSDAALR